MRNTSLEAIREENDLSVTILLGSEISYAYVQSGEQNIKNALIKETTQPRLFTTIVRHHLEYGNVVWCQRF